jgi:hypothetical protein
MMEPNEIQIINYYELFDKSKEYFIENRKSEKTGIGRVAKSLTDYASKEKVKYVSVRNTIFGGMDQFSIFNLFLFLFGDKKKIHIFPYTIFPPIGLSKINYIFFVLDLYQFEGDLTLKEIIYNKIFIHFVRNANTIIFLSCATRDSFFKVFHKNFLEKEFYIVSSQVFPNLQITGKVCLYVGSNKNNKNIDFLEKIAMEFVSHDNRKFIFVGIASDDFVKQNTNYIFMSGIEDDLLSLLYGKVNYVVSTSTDEGLCFPVKDAVHHCTKVLALNIPVFDELYKNNDLVTLFENEQNMLKYIENI